jgi:hypothetical protein
VGRGCSSWGRWKVENGGVILTRGEKGRQRYGMRLAAFWCSLLACFQLLGEVIGWGWIIGEHGEAVAPFIGLSSGRGTVPGRESGG